MGAARFSNLNNPELMDMIPGCVNFRWHEALYLPRWDLYVYPNDMVYQNIIKTARVMDVIHNMFGKPVTVDCWYRPFPYNDLVGGAHLSSHCEGLAVDFNVITVQSAKVRETLLPQLQRLSIRMENNEEIEKKTGKTWVHIDLRAPGPAGRFFKP